MFLHKNGNKKIHCTQIPWYNTIFFTEGKAAQPIPWQFPQTGVAGVVDSQENKLPDHYNRDPAATQRIQVAITSARSSSTCDEDYDIENPNQLSSVASTPCQYYHGSNWDTSQKRNSTAAQLLSVGGPPRCFTLNPTHLMYNGSQLSSVAGTPRDPTWRSSEERNSSSSSEEVYHRSSSSEEVYPDGDERPPSNVCNPIGNITIS